MKLILEEMREIAKRLPIGYYLGLKASVTVEEGMRAYADTVKHDIHIGLGVLQAAADNIDASDAAKWDREKLLRCLLYHEVGHLLLTPAELKYISVQVRGELIGDKASHTFVNIFEDERLERILSKFFMGVDFRGFCLLVNKKAGEAKTDDMRFFNAVRLRRTTPAISAAVDNAIEELKTVNAGRLSFLAYHSCLQILIDMVIPEEEEEEEKPEDGGDGAPPKDSPERPDKPDGTPDEDKPEDVGDSGTPDGGERKPDEASDPEKPDSKGDKEDGDSEEDGDGDPDGTDDGEDKPDGEGKPDGEDGDEGGDGKGDEGEGENPDASEKPKPDGDETTGCDDAGEPGEDVEDGGEGIAPREIELPEDFLKKTAKTVFVEPTSEVAATLRRFATRLSKKKGAQAAGRWSGLHGRIDTKRDAQDKLRIFRRTSDVGESLMSAVNLTLWVDVSGSFRGSKNVLNQILSATATAMGMSGGKLAVNVVKMGDYARVAAPTDWAVNPDEGNSINRTYHKAWMDTRRKDRRNIDIVVFDGNAKSDDRVRSQRMPNGTPVEKVIWDHPDCHIICDTTNHRHFGCLRKAHVTYVDGHYAERLQGEVIKTLDRIL